MSRVKSGKIWRKRANGWACLLWLLVLALAAVGGCTRVFFRKQADRDAFALLKEKDIDRRWAIGRYNVYPDPRSRFADWTRWDRPPMPPDDPYAKFLSPNPQKPYHKAGIAYTEGSGYFKVLEEWNEENRRAEAERKAKIKRLKAPEEKGPKKLIGAAGPSPPVIDAMKTYEMQNEMAEPVSRTGLLPARRPAKKKRPYLLTMNQAVELAQFNSRELQTARENLYLSALPVSAERFSFAAQGFAISQIIRQTAGLVPENNWAFNTTGGFTKLFSTGALLLTQFANQTVVNLGNLFGKNPVTSQSTMSLDIVQPFLRGGGRAVTLEPLTQAERNLLYAVRDYGRFRQGFYSFITVGQAAFIVGQSAGVTALPIGTVQTPGVFVPDATPLASSVAGPNVAVQVPPGSGEHLGVIQPLGANPTGFLQTLSQKVDLVVARKNVASYDYFLKLFQVWKEGGLVNPVQVGQIEQNYLTAIQNMLTQWVQYRQFLDLFRIQLGLPTTINLELDDGPIQHLYDLLDRYEDHSVAYNLAFNQVMKFNKYDEAAKLRERLHGVMATAPLVQDLPYQQEAPRRWAAWEQLKPAKIHPKLEKLKAERRKLLDRKADLQLQNRLLSEPEQDRLEKLNFEIDLGYFEGKLREYEAQPWKAEAKAKLRENLQRIKFLEVHRAFGNVLAPATKERLAQIRESWQPLPPVNVGEIDLLSAADDTALNTVVDTAFNNRLDLMNQRAQLVDSWRKLRVAANALLGVFNVEYHLDSTTPPGLDAPFAFSESRTHHELAFNTQLPIVRRVERNNYRSALVAYQQQRRQYMDALDQIAFAVRFQLRNLRIAAYNFQKVQRRNMELAYLVVDQALQAFNQPAVPTGGGGLVSPPGGQPQNPDPAALTQQLRQAQGSLVAAQTALFTTWLGYLQNRIGLFRDMGLMPLDSRGLWMDDVSYPPEEQKLREHHGEEAPLLVPGYIPQRPQGEPEGASLGQPETLPPARILPPLSRPPGVLP